MEGQGVNSQAALGAPGVVQGSGTVLDTSTPPGENRAQKSFSSPKNPSYFDS